MTKATAHKGDPCIYCGTPHDDVKPGPCPARLKVVEKAVQGAISVTLEAALDAFPTDLRLIRTIVRERGQQHAVAAIYEMLKQSGGVETAIADMGDAIDGLYETFKDVGVSP
tara:strand:+ start:286 stop:621 length:336 start_codon:yes stop_codon:yes gene_type:complete